MIDTQWSILYDLVKYPDSTPSEIGARIFFAPNSVRKYLRGSLAPFVIKTKKHRGRTSATYRTREGAIDWPLERPKR